MKKILIVEDELMIAGNLERMLLKHGYEVPAIAIDFDQAMEALDDQLFDLVLLDINLSGKRGGVDVAHEINKHHKIPFMYITSNTNKPILEKLKETKPVGYLSKPTQAATLTTNIDIIFESLGLRSREILIHIGSSVYCYELDDVLYAQADHVYTELFHKKGSDVLRISLHGLLEEFPQHEMIRVNRSVAVRRKAIDRMDKTHVYVQDKVFKISRSLSDEVSDALD